MHTPPEEIRLFLEMCLRIATSGPATQDGTGVRKDLRVLARALCPDLVSGSANVIFDVEAGEIVVETEQTFYRIAARAIAR